MVSKIGYSELVRGIQALERKGIRSTEESASEEESVDVTMEDRVDVYRDGDLDPETLRLIDQILDHNEE